MGAKSHIAKWGTSLAVRIPSPSPSNGAFAKARPSRSVSHGDQVMMRKRTYNLADMLDQVTEDNLHPELDTGPAQGNEAW